MGLGMTQRGNLYYSSGDFPIERLHMGSFREKHPHGTSYPSRVTTAANHPGEWELKLYLDDKLVASKPFVIEAAAMGLALTGVCSWGKALS